MPHDTNTEMASSAEAEPESAQSAPPPFEPDMDLIGYVERGQMPSPPRPAPSDAR